MRRLIAIVFAVAVLALLRTPKAEAGIPIPCTGESVVTVVQTPPEMRIPIAEGKSVHVDLGYKFNGCSGGEWVAYPGKGRSYYKLSEPQLRLLLATAGRTEFPDTPSFLMHPSASWAAWLWIVIGTFVVAGTALAKYAQAHAPQPVTQQAAGHAQSAPQSPPIPAQRRVANPVPTSGRSVVSPARSSFGRRA